MEWSNIKEKYPKSFEALREWHKSLDDQHKPLTIFAGHLFFSYAYNPPQAFEMFNTRDLYDFFDSKGIFISLNYDPTMRFLPKIRFGDSDSYFSLSDSPTRQQAEQEAFERAFAGVEASLIQELAL